MERFRISLIYARRVETVFIAPQQWADRFVSAPMGMGNCVISRLNAESNWREHLILEVSPFLENFILELRYKLAPTHQLLLETGLTGSGKSSGLATTVMR